jgi:hypothetical protein
VFSFATTLGLAFVVALEAALISALVGVFTTFLATGALTLLTTFAAAFTGFAGFAETLVDFVDLAVLFVALLDTVLAFVLGLGATFFTAAFLATGLTAFLAGTFLAGAFLATTFLGVGFFATGFLTALGFALGVLAFFVTTFLVTFFEAEAFLALGAVINESPLTQLPNLIVKSKLFKFIKLIYKKISKLKLFVSTHYSISRNPCTQ